MILPKSFEKPKLKVWSGSTTRLDYVIQSYFWILFFFWNTHFQDLIQSDSRNPIRLLLKNRPLGVTLDSQLSHTANITATTRSCRFMLYNSRRIRPLLTQKAAQVLVQALVISRIDYFNSLPAGLPTSAIRPLQLIQNAAARLVFNQPKFSHTTPLLCSLHWLPVAARIRFKTLVLAYRAANGSGPLNIQDMVKRYTPARSLRSASANQLVAPSLRAKHSSNHDCLLSWLLNGGMSSPLTSGQQKVYTSSATN